VCAAAVAAAGAGAGGACAAGADTLFPSRSAHLLTPPPPPPTTQTNNQPTITTTKQRIYKLPDLWVRPGLGGRGRKIAGALEAHANGFRYMNPKGEGVDVMYRNIRHAFFQVLVFDGWLCLLCVFVVCEGFWAF
jgi:hypothetical protein